MSGDSSSLAIHAGMTEVSPESAGFGDGTGSSGGLFFPVSPPDVAPAILTGARGTGFAVGVNGSLRGDGLCSDGGGPATLARGPRFDALSDEAGPQPDSPARSIRLRSSASRGHSRCRDGRDG